MSEGHCLRSMTRIAVIGGGVIGLSSAINIQKSLPEAEVHVISKDDPQDTTSSGAGGIFLPVRERVKTSGIDIRKVLGDSWRYFASYALSEEAPKRGFRVTTGYVCKDEDSDEQNELYAKLAFTFRELSVEEKSQLGFHSYRHVYQVTTIIVNMKIYLPFLYSLFQANGGKIIREKVIKYEQLTNDYDLIVNCSGLGSQQLENDVKLQPNRGQLVMVKAPYIKHWIFGREHTYIIPNNDDYVVIGGIRQPNNYSMEVSASDREKVLENASQLWPPIKNAPIVSEWVGLRPHRDPIRLEKEFKQLSSGQKVWVVHNYGHGANGVALSWGTSLAAAEMVKDIVTNSNHTTMSKL